MSQLVHESSNTCNLSGRSRHPSNETNSGHPKLLPPSLIVILSFMCLLIIIVNGLVIFLIHKKKTLRTLTNMFLVSLAFSGLISGLVGIPLLVICLVRDDINICVSSTIFIRFTAISSVCHVLFIAIDRYVFIVHYMEYHSLVTRQRALVAIIAVWLLPLVASVIQLSWYIFYQVAVTDFEKITEEVNKQYSLACIVAFFAVPLLLMCYIYGRIFHISIKRNNSHRQMNNTFQQPCRPLGHEWRGRSVLVISMGIFTGCWLPFFFAMLDDYTNASEQSTMSLYVQRLLVFLGFIPPILNPILCTLAKKDFRRALKEIWFEQKTNNMSAGIVVHREQICLNVLAT